MKITDDIPKINEIKEIARKNMLLITDEDEEYINNNICDILYVTYFVIDEWEKFKSAFECIQNMEK